MIVFTKDIQYNQCKREDILNDQNQKYINSLKHELKTGKGLINTALRYMPEMHLSLPNTVESENIPNGSFQNTGKYSYCGPFFFFFFFFFFRSTQGGGIQFTD